MTTRNKKGMPPLADISAGGRALRAAKSRIKHFRVGLIKGIEAEIGETQNEQTRLNLDQARKWLQGPMKQLIQLAEANPDCRYGAKILNVSFDAMYTCANAVSRIDRNLVQRMIEPLIEKKAKKAFGGPGGKASGAARHAEAEEGWKPHALQPAKQGRKEQPGITQAELAHEIKTKWRLKIRCPGTQLIPAISGWEKDGTLTRRHK
jgi:hypothetical protein